jgi:type I restriction enzyme S subunit
MDKGSAQSTVPSVRLPMLLNFRICIPPIEEQQAISAYLDKKCFEIDSLTADIQKQIETLEEYKRSIITEAVTKGLNPDAEMKDSGVQWVGETPTHWKLNKGKYILKYLQKPVRENDGVITCFRDGEVTLRSNRREDGFTMADKEIGYQGIDVGDLVVHGMDGFAGAIGISDSRGKASPVLNVLDTDQNKQYIMYYLRSMAYNNVFLALATGIRVRSCDLRWNKLAELLYPLPPIEEQQKIVAYIDSVLERANGVISDKKKQLETLEEYKKSLIFEYVTGKKEIY